MTKRSEDAFNGLWECIVGPALRKLAVHNGVSVRKSARDDVWRAYRALNRHTSETYMRDANERIDRHKVAACYTYAVLLSMPLVVEGKLEESHLNERVALYVGCSVLASFLRRAVERAPGFVDNAERDRVLARIKEGVRFPDPVGHGGTYVQSVLNCLAFTQMEGHYNVLMLALLYYDWELTLMELDDHELVIRYYEDIAHEE